MRIVTPVKGLIFGPPPPVSIQSVVGVNLARNVPYDYSSALRNRLANRAVEYSLRLQSRFLTYIPAPALWSIRLWTGNSLQVRRQDSYQKEYFPLEIVSVQGTFVLAS